MAHAYLGGVRGSFNQPGWDIRTDAGERVQVKGIWRTRDTRGSNTSVIRGRDYDSVVVVEFDKFFETAAGLSVSREVVLASLDST